VEKEIETRGSVRVSPGGASPALMRAAEVREKKKESKKNKREEKKK